MKSALTSSLKNPGRFSHSDSDEWVKVEHRHLFDPFARTISESE